LRIYFSQSTSLNKSISENTDTGPANFLIPQIRTGVEMVELQTHMGTESSNLIPQVETAVVEVGLETNTGTSESGAMIPPLTTALTTNTGTEPASWICRVHDALERGDANDFSEVVCWKVPDSRRATSDHFDPKSWRFGLHNRAPDTLQTDGTEHFKIQVARALSLTGDRWKEFWRPSRLTASYQMNPHPIVRDCVRRNGGVVGGFEAPELAGEARGERRGGLEQSSGSFAVVPQSSNPKS
jgi:hypothetical protein